MGVRIYRLQDTACANSAILPSSHGVSEVYAPYRARALAYTRGLQRFALRQRLRHQIRHKNPRFAGIIAIALTSLSAPKIRVHFDGAHPRPDPLIARAATRDSAPSVVELPIEDIGPGWLLEAIMTRRRQQTLLGHLSPSKVL